MQLIIIFQPLLDEEETDYYFMTRSELLCKFVIGFLALVSLGAACLFLGYYFGFLNAKGCVMIFIQVHWIP